VIKYQSNSHCKYLLKYHLILTVKYRHKLLINLNEFVKQVIKTIANDYNINIDVVESDKNHIHMLLDLTPTQRVCDIVAIIKSITTKELWENHKTILSKKLWGTRSFWNSGYFVCTTGDASTETIKRYIENQG